MKKIYILFILTGLISVGCEEYLERTPDMGITDEEVFSSYYSMRGFLDRATYAVRNYNYHHTQHTVHQDIDNLCDGGVPMRFDIGARVRMNAGDWQNLEYRDFNCIINYNELQKYQDAQRDQFIAAFPAIRVCNMFFANLDRVEDWPSETGYTQEELKNQLIGQAYFLRGWHFFQLIKRRGGLAPLDKVYNSDDDLDFEHLSYRESTNWAISNFDSAAMFLPSTWDAVNRGRPTKSSALAYKAYLLLWDSSPLTNPDDGYNYDVERCKETVAASIEAFNEVEATNGYYYMYPFGERTAESGNYVDGWHENTHSWITKTSREALFQPYTSHWAQNNSWNGGMGFTLPIFDGGQKMWTAPTQNAVDWFETADGYAIEDAPPTSYDPQDPYVNRDPRLYESIYYNDGESMYITSDLGPIPTKVEAWAGGFHMSSIPGGTGYIAKKRRWPGNNKYDRTSSNPLRWFPHLRLAELYLIYAEAANEAYGPTGAVPGSDLTAADALNVVRNRATMPDVLPMYTSSKEALRERIRNERAVEFYLEWKRLHDLRRWRQVEKCNTTYKASIIKSGDTFIYGKELISGNQAKTYDNDKHVWYPWHTNMLDMLENLKQNPNW